MKLFDDLWVEFFKKVIDWFVDFVIVVVLDVGVYLIGKKIIEEVGEVWLVVEYESDEVLVEEIS